LAACNGTATFWGSLTEPTFSAPPAMPCATWHRHHERVTMTNDAQPMEGRSADATPSSLTVEDSADLPLADLLGQSGCPLCRLRQRTARRSLESILWESVNDRGFRARLSRDRGFCPTHTREALEVDRSQGGGTLGASILFGAIVRDRLAELNAIGTKPGRGSGRALDATRSAPSCPVCREVEKTKASARLRLLNRISDPAWAAAVSEAQLCLRDLLALWAAADGRRAAAAAWPAVAATQVARVAELLSRLDGFAAHNAYNRLGEMTDSERAAAAEAAAFLSARDD